MRARILPLPNLVYLRLYRTCPSRATCSPALHLHFDAVLTTPQERRSPFSVVSLLLRWFDMSYSRFVVIYVPPCISLSRTPPLTCVFAKGSFCQIDPTLPLFEEINCCVTIFSSEGLSNKRRKARVGYLACGRCVRLYPAL